MRNHLLAIGIMTGNSLDGADLVLTRIGRDPAEMVDLGALAVPFPEGLKDDLRAVRAAVNAAEGWVERAVDALGPGMFDATLGRYTDLLVEAVATLRARVATDLDPIDVIGLHGQTCAHRPPSIVGTGQRSDAYTVQIADPRGLADRTGITVVADFRSDDLMAGGEGAPLAPMHHRHLAATVRHQGIPALAFANGGNTGNLSVIAPDQGQTALRVLGWDTGPFNHFPDRLMQLQGGQPCDWEGAVGRQGGIDRDLLGLLFRSAVVTGSGANFLLQPPPRSSDPEWYRLLPELLGAAPVLGRVVRFADRVRTATYFATYILTHSLALIPPSTNPPTHFAVCGGGWQNPLCLEDFRALLGGDPAAPILVEHEAHFQQLRTWTTRAVVAPSATFGVDGTAMEARIFADAAVCRVRGEPFTRAETTGASQPTVCGIIRFPAGDRTRSTREIRRWLDWYRSGKATFDRPHRFDPRWSRASAGWVHRAHGSPAPPARGT